MGGESERNRIRESLHDHSNVVRVTAAETLLDWGGDDIIDKVGCPAQ